MLPSIQSVASRHGSPNRQHKRSSSSGGFFEEPVVPIPMAKECTESTESSQTRNHPSGQKSRYVAEGMNGSATNDGRKPTRVKLKKALSPNHKPSHFFVRTAGGMSVSVPELSPEVNMSVKDQINFIPSDPVPQLDGNSLSQNESPSVEGASKNETNRAQTYLPLSVELVAGRGQTSMPSDGNKNSGSGAKVRSLPPSHTLAMSASLIKSYFSSGPEKQQSKSAGSTPDTETSVKTKMIGLWNNVKYGWTVNLKTNFSRDAPVYLLGRVYHKSFGDMENSEEELEQHGIEAFKKHFHSLIWCTYRRQFPTLQNSTLTTDCGWGCMLRSGQMMLAHALIRHFLTREWRYDKHVTDGPEEEIHRSIVRWLGDSPSPDCPLSLHNLVHFGHKLGKKAGDWYGPASVAYIFKEAVEMGSKYIKDLQRICIYVAQDCAVYIQDVLDLCSTSCLCNKGKLTQTAKEAEAWRLRMRQMGKSGRNYLDQSSQWGHVESSGRDSNRVNGQENHMNGTKREGQNEKLSSENLAGDMARVNAGAASLLDENHYLSFRDLERVKHLNSSAGHKDVKKLPEKGTSNACPECDNWRSVLIMVPVRLGGEGLNPIYESCLYALFTHDLCIGIIGGRPKHSLYFVGFQEESLIHLDPHLCQDAVMVTQPVFPVSSYHCSSPRKMALSRMDPSATLGFYCHSRTDFLRLMEELPEILTPKQPGFDYPIFEFVDGRCEDTDACTRQVSTEDQMAASLPRDTPLLPQDSEEFVFL